MATLIIDNYDSFTFNLYHLLQQAAPPNEIVDIKKNDEIGISDLKHYEKIVASPGPGVPKEAGSLLKIIASLNVNQSFLGICLGHQALAECFGAGIYQLSHPRHGETSWINITNSNSIFRNLPSKIKVTLYHSWAVNRKTLPDIFNILAEKNDGTIMALQHKTKRLYGLQFHPESFCTTEGIQIMKNFYRQS